MKLLLLIVLLTVSLVNAQWSTTSNDHLMVAEGGEEPKICSDGNGGAYVIWSNFSYDKTRIYLQHVDKFGIKSLTTPMIVSDTSDLQREREIVEDGYGGVIIMVSAYKVVGQIGGFKLTNTKIFLQRIDKNLNKLWGENGVRVSMQENNQDCYAHPKLVTDKKHNAYLFFGERKDTGDGEKFNLFMQRIRYDGQRMWGDSGITIAVNVGTPKWVLSSNINNRIIIWYAQAGGSGPWRRLSGYDTLGNRLWEKMITDSYLHFGKISTNKLFITRQKTVDGYQEIFQTNIFNSEGDSLWEQWQTIADSTSFKITSSNVRIISDSVLVANYFKLVTFPSMVQQYTQAITQSGELLYPYKFRYTRKNVNQYKHGDFVQGMNNAFLALYSFPTDSSLNTYVQKVNLKGELLWDSLGVLLSSKIIPDIGGVYFYYIISDQLGGAIALGSNEPHEGIFVQHINKNGVLGDVLSNISRDEQYSPLPISFDVSNPYPNPFNPSTTINIINGQEQQLTIKIYDIVGKEIINETIMLSEGAYRYTVNLDRYVSNPSSSIYFVTISNKYGNTHTKKLLLLK